MEILINSAIQYKIAQLSIVPVKQNKEPLNGWCKYQVEVMPDFLLQKLFRHRLTKGIAIVCGKISAGFEAIDLDCKYDLTGSMFKDFVLKINDANSDLVTRLVVARTRNAGFHFYYRCPDFGRNTILAQRNCTEDEKKKNLLEKLKVLIETRGEGGYVIVPPTNGYEFIQHDFSNIPLIAPEERKLLVNVAVSFNQIHRPASFNQYFDYAEADPESPFDDFNRRGDVIELLQRHGWKVVRRTGNKTFFVRPGITEHETSGDYHHGLCLFGVFTTSTEFEPGKGYKPYAVYAILECNGDFRLAAKRLLDEGYGIPYSSRY